jgi:3-dehydroquinate synthase
MGMDKKVQQKRLRFVLLQGLGEAFVSSDYDAARLDAVLAGAA